MLSPDDLRRLLSYAEAGRADPRWLAKVARETVETLLEVQELRQALGSRLASIERARAIKHAIAAGATPEQVQARFGIARSTYYRLKASF
jgi:hypothetical protein